MGNSAMDIAVDASYVARTTTISGAARAVAVPEVPARPAQRPDAAAVLAAVVGRRRAFDLGARPPAT
jgi:hypothetical protein